MVKDFKDAKSEYGIKKEVLAELTKNNDANLPEDNEIFSRVLNCSEAMGMFPRNVITPDLFCEVIKAIDAHNGVRSLVPKMKGEIQLAQSFGKENLVLKLPPEGVYPIIMVFQPRVGVPDQAPSVEDGTEGRKHWGSIRILPNMPIEDYNFQQGARLLLNQQGWAWDDRNGKWIPNPRFNTLFVSGIPKGGFGGREQAFNSYDTVQNHQAILIAVQDVLKVAGLLPVNPPRGEMPKGKGNAPSQGAGTSPQSQEPKKTLSADEKAALLADMSP